MKQAAKILIFSLILLVSACKTERPSGGEDDKPFFVTTTGMVMDALVNLAGDQADIIALMGPGVDPHLYQATPGDLAKLNKADLIVCGTRGLGGIKSFFLGSVSHKLLEEAACPCLVVK